MLVLLLACTVDPADDASLHSASSHSGHSASTADTGRGSTVATGHTGATGSTGDTARAPTADTGPPWDQVPDFVLTDLSPVSPTSGQAMSPRDEVGKVSGWYFTHAS